MVSLMKRNNCQKALYHSRILMECFGGNAASDEYPISRIAANAHVVSTYEGTYDVHVRLLFRLQGRTVVLRFEGKLTICRMIRASSSARPSRASKPSSDLEHTNIPSLSLAAILEIIRMPS